MALDPKRLRLWFGAAAILLLVVIAGFFLYARYRLHRVLSQVQKLESKYGIEVQQSAQGFQLSRSEGGRTLFTIRASKMLQFKQGGRAELQDVSIIVYGRNSTRYDQIYGARFEYDPQTGEVRALGPVQIDLESNADTAPHPDQAPPLEMKNPVHLKTSGLSFNSKTGMARTAERIEFRTRLASGSALGASYDSHRNQLTLDSQVAIHSSGRTPADVTAVRAVITKEPLLASLESVQGEGPSGHFAADRVQIFFRLDASAQRALASGNVRAWRAGEAAPDARSARAHPPADFHAEQAELFVAEDNTLHHAVLAGNVMFDVGGPRALHGQAQRLLVDFGPKSRVRHVRALQSVALTQQPGAPAPAASAPARNAFSSTAQSLQFTAADALDADVKNGRLDRAWTTGPAQIVLAQASSAASASGPPAGSRTTITAARFDAAFDGRNHLRSLHGEPDARIVSSTPGQPDRITTSSQVDIALNATGNGVASIAQQGDFRYTEGTRRATSERARYTVADELFQLSGDPRYSDTGISLSANSLRLNRRTGDVNADGDVKSTYADLKPQGQGAMLASGSPVHVTAAAMVAHHATTGPAASATARFTGNARLWQDASLVQAPSIEFDRDRRTLLAQASPQQPVSTVFVQQDRTGKVTPLNVTSAQLSYADSERKAHFTGGVTVRGQDSTLTGDRADVILQPRTPLTPSVAVPSSQNGPSQVQQIVVETRIVIEQRGRRATGDRLVYTPLDGKFVLTGGPPSIFDAEHGKITGDTLTFFSHDDRVLVESGSSTRFPPSRTDQ